MGDINLSVSLTTDNAAKKANEVAVALRDVGDSVTDVRLQLVVLTKKLNSAVDVLTKYKTGITGFSTILNNIGKGAANAAIGIASFNGNIAAGLSGLEKYKSSINGINTQNIQGVGSGGTEKQPKQMSVKTAEALARHIQSVGENSVTTANQIQTFYNKLGGFIKLVDKYKVSLKELVGILGAYRAVSASVVTGAKETATGLSTSSAAINKVADSTSRVARQTEAYTGSLDRNTRASFRATSANKTNNAILSDQVGFWRFAGKFAPSFSNK